MNKLTIIYSEWYDIIKELPDDIRLKVVDAIFAYGFEGKLPTDELVKAHTALMIKGINRTREQYQDKCEKNRQNIKRRWQKLKQNERIQQNTNVYERIQSLPTNTNATNYNYNNNNNYNHNYNSDVSNDTTEEYKEKNNNIDDIIKKEKKDFNEESFIEDYFANFQMVETLQRQTKLKKEQLRQLADEVFIEWQASGTTHRDFKDAHYHLTNTIKIKAKNLPKDYFRPPRPDKYHEWSDVQNKWVYVG